MVECPRCHQSVDSKAIACPYCRTPLKAHGHPGIPLYRASGEEYLCDSCTYHADDSCNFPQRPYARECTLYHNPAQQPMVASYKPSFSNKFNHWVRRNGALLTLLGIVGVSLAIAFSRR